MQHDGELETKSVSRQNFNSKKGERYAVKKPCDADILFGDSLFRAETHSQIEFTAKKGDAFEIVKPTSSDIWKVSNQFLRDLYVLVTYLSVNILLIILKYE